MESSGGKPLGIGLGAVYVGLQVLATAVVGPGPGGTMHSGSQLEISGS